MENIGSSERDVSAAAQGQRSDQDDGASFGEGSHYENQAAQESHVEAEIAHEDTKTILKLRSALFIFLVLSTIGVAVTIVLYIRGSETTQFNKHYHDSASKVLGGIGALLDESLGAADAFTVAMISYARATANNTDGSGDWPFVTIPDFAVRGSKLRTMSKAFLMAQYNLVTDAQREDWEEYSRTHLSWIDEGIDVQKTDPTFRGAIVEDWFSSGFINSNGQPADKSDIYLPRWQSSPVVPRYDPANWDPLSEIFLKPSLDVVLQTQEVVISTAYNLWDFSDPDQVEKAAELATGFVDFIGPDEDPSEPGSEFYYPIRDTQNQVQIEGNSTVVGIIALSIFWRDMVLRILPPGSDGMVAVFENTCGQSFTYQIDGPEASYLGSGDHHNSKYDRDMETSSLVMDLKKYATGRDYTGARINRDYCPFKISVYPSQAMENKFITSTPYIFMTASIVIFAFTSLMFILYDWIVRRRQRTVMHTAKRSSAIVSSLFPSNVRDRLYGDETKTGSDTDNPPKNALSTVLTKSECDSQEKSVPGSKPICDLFLETTVIFADIKGFTSWSAKRDPPDVFLLLETLYKAFDDLAERHGIFKVETIGDSYVAVCGLPEPRRDHVTVIARFAMDIRNTTNVLTKQLVDQLGADTADLVMRIGFNSGPTTAGVLRGQRARFQLFGDTVNTASRMESKGIGDQIQCSQASAELLAAAGKGHWVREREDLIEAKGKGTMQTYWVERPRASP